MFDAKGTINKVMLIGRLGQDPELKHSQSGTAVLNLSVATNSKSKDEVMTEWSKVVAFGKLAETIAQYGKKGSLVYIEGRLQTRSWEKDGKKQYTTEIIANQIQMLGGRDEQRDEQQNEDLSATALDDRAGVQDDLPF